VAVLNETTLPKTKWGGKKQPVNRAKIHALRRVFELLSFSRGIPGAVSGSIFFSGSELCFFLLAVESIAAVNYSREPIG
jgi:hypothetical protein